MPVPGLQGGRVAGFCRVERAVCSQIPIAFAIGPFIGRARTVMPSKECTLRPTIYNICGKTPTPEQYKSTLTPEHTNKPKSVKQNKTHSEMAEMAEETKSGLSMCNL
jgi:hypothetical protein